MGDKLIGWPQRSKVAVLVHGGGLKEKRRHKYVVVGAFRAGDVNTSSVNRCSTGRKPCSRHVSPPQHHSTGFPMCCATPCMLHATTRKELWTTTPEKPPCRCDGNNSRARKISSSYTRRAPLRGRVGGWLSFVSNKSAISSANPSLLLIVIGWTKHARHDAA